MSEQFFDVAVVGGGPGGYVAALRAAQLGLTVGLVERGPTLGGTCLNIGCIPSKALLSSSHHYQFLRHEAAAHGILAEGVSLDLPKMIARKDQVVRTLTDGIDLLVKRRGITRVVGTAKLLGPGQLEITAGDGFREPLAAKNIILAAGSIPAQLASAPCDGRTIVTSTEALAFNRVPASLVVIGAGAIGLELGSVWARLGTKVTVLEFLPRIAPGIDLETAQALQRALEKQGLAFHLQTEVRSVQAGPESARVVAAKDGREFTLEAEKVLVCVGRKPCSADLAAPEAGLKLDPRGRVEIDDHFRTSVPGAFAIGDLVRGPMLAHKAEEEGYACAEIIAGRSGHVNYAVVPGVVYTHPEAAAVGITQQEAEAAHRPVRAGKFFFAANGRALAGGETAGFVKVIADATTDRLLGVHILHANASELVAEAVMLMEFRGSAEDLARTVHAHPTLSEALKEAALCALGQPLHSAR